jgi:transcription initiation factor TFIID subunit 4
VTVAASVASASVVKNLTQANQIKQIAQIKQTQLFTKVDTSSNNIINSNSTTTTTTSVVSINNSNSNNNQKISSAATTTTLPTNVVVVNSNNIINSSSCNILNEIKIQPTINNKTIKSQSTAKKQSTANAEKADKKNAVSAAATAATSFYQPSSVYGDDDINDVAAMGGVNLAEETQRILGSTEFVGVQIRSCKDEVFLNLPQLQNKIRAIVAKHGLEEPNNEVAVLVSHATQERLKNVLEKLAIIAEHRIDVIKVIINLVYSANLFYCGRPIKSHCLGNMQIENSHYFLLAPNFL